MYNDQPMSRNERQRQLNRELSVLPTFTPLNDCQIYHINRSTSSIILQDLIQLARKTKRYTIDTELDYYTHEPALIQIEFIAMKSVVLLIETCHLPRPSSVLFWLIQSLFKVIFQSSNLIYVWGDFIFELTHFLHCGLFSSTMLNQVNTMNVQLRFKQWYNQVFLHRCGLPSVSDDHQLCTCFYRPVKHKNNQWSLQKAIAYTFHEFLDKRRTKSNWSRRLSSNSMQQYSMLNEQIKQLHEHLILYAVNDCLAVTKLLMVIEFNWTKAQLHQYNEQ